MKAIIIGGVAAGMSAASKLKRMESDARVTVYERGSFLSYGACGLPYYIGGVNPDPKRLIVRSREHFEKMGIDTFLRHEAVNVDTEKRTVTIRELDTGREFGDSYDTLLIAVGCDSFVPPIEGADVPGVFYIKSLEDALLMEKIVTTPGVGSAVIVGGGYIGVEMVEAMLERGLRVTLIEAADRLLGPFEREFSALVLEELTVRGAQVSLGEKVTAIAPGATRRTVETQKARYEGDIVIMCAGVVPATSFLKASGIRMARNGAIVVDREMRTSCEHVFSAGDCAVTYNRITREHFFLPLGTVANKCGRIAGGNMAGRHDKFPGALGTAAIKVCGLEMARTGMSQADAIRLGQEYDSVLAKARNLPEYYPGGADITIGLLWEKGTKRLLGANVAGAYGSGAVLRCDMFALAIQAGMTTEELGMADLAYAPPFSSVWDAVHIAANAAK